MTKMKFKRTPTYDKTIADKGVNVKLERYGHYMGTMRVRFVDTTLQTVNKELQLNARRYKTKLGVDKLDERQGYIATLAYYAIIGWSDIVDDKDKPVEFSTENLLAFFEDEDETNWMIGELVNVAVDGTKFQSLETLEAAEKN